MINIRNYQKTDYQQVKAILQEANLFDEVWDSEENLSGMIEKDPQSIIVAVDKNIIIGQVIIIPYGSKIEYLFRLAVKREFRKQGTATLLINFANKIAQKRKISEIGLYVETGNKKLQSFYQKRGFKISSKQYYYMWNEQK